MNEMFLSIALIFAYLEITMLMATVGLEVVVDEKYDPQYSFLSSNKVSTAELRLNFTPGVVTESTIFSMTALLGRLYGSAAYSYRRSELSNYEIYWWIFVTPWLVDFLRHWLWNLAALLGTIIAPDILPTANYWSTIIMMGSFYMLQGLLARKVALVVLRGWRYSIMDEPLAQEFRRPQRRNGYRRAKSTPRRSRSRRPRSARGMRGSRGSRVSRSSRSPRRIPHTNTSLLMVEGALENRMYSPDTESTCSDRCVRRSRREPQRVTFGRRRSRATSVY